MTDDMQDRLLAHYELPGLLERIDAGLAAIGEDPAQPSLEALARVDEFHLRGPAATAELIEALGVGAGDHVLDIGCGLGGPARRLARASGCRVTGLDITPSYCAAAQELTARTGLADRVGFHCRPVEDLADEDPGFDAAWTIHVGMNVADKPGFYRAILRCLKPGGRLLVYDVLAGAGAAPVFPMPWAATPAESFLVAATELEAALVGTGFTIETVHDDTDAALAFMQGAVQRLSALPAPPPLGLHTVLGPVFQQIAANLVANLAAGAIVVGRVQCLKPH